MTRREQLQERYEDALFALLMDDYAVLEGEKAWQENERLKTDPTAAVPEGTRRRCKKTIQKSFAADKARAAGRITMKVIQRVAVVGFAATLLFTAAFAASTDLRVNTLNFVIDMFDDRTVFYSEATEARVPQQIIANWLPEGYELVDYSAEPEDVKAWYQTSEGKEVVVHVYGLSRTTVIDTEGAGIGTVLIDGNEAVTICKSGLDGDGNSYEHSSVIWLDAEGEWYVDISSYQESVKCLIQIAEELEFK